MFSIGIVENIFFIEKRENAIYATYKYKKI
jgi:hypothetical protein